MSPTAIKGAIQLAAAPLHDYAPHEVGAGFFDYSECLNFISTFGASYLVRLLTIGGERALTAAQLAALDATLGPLWSAAEVELLTHWFYRGRTVSVAKVIW